jgi:F-type H+-transporting ATPase subunit b
MEKIFVQLQEIVVRAIPTFLLVFLLYFYLKRMLFKPLEHTLQERARRTMGAAAEAEAKLADFLKKEGAYLLALTEARSGIYKEMEDQRKALAAEQAQAVEASRSRTAELIAKAKLEIAAEAEQAKQSLAGETDRLAEEIAVRLLTRSARS